MFNKISIYVLVLLLVSSCGAPKKIMPDPEPAPLPAFYVPDNIRVALVLGSGGVRGMAHVGVVEELEAAGIPIDLIVGCSAGSVVGALYADRPCAKYVKEAVSNIRSNSILDIDIMNCRYGLSQTRNLNKVMDYYLNATTFDQLQIPLVIVASDLHSAELVPLGGGDLVTAVRASCSIPFFFVPCKHLGRVFVDGGVINPVPVKVAKDLGAQVVIAVDLGELLPQTFPTNLFGVATRSAEIAFLWQNDQCTREADIVIRPKTCDCGTFDDSKKWVIYEAGKKAAQEQIPLIKEKIIALKDCRPSREHRLVQPKCYAPAICK